MKLNTEISNQWKIIKKIYDNGSGTFDWGDMKEAIEGLIDLERIKIKPDYFESISKYRDIINLLDKNKTE